MLAATITAWARLRRTGWLRQPSAAVVVAVVSTWAAVAGLGPTSVAAEPAAAPTTGLPVGLGFVRSLEGVHEYRLANGLQILLLPDTASPKITVNIVYRVGSRHEVYGETGMAHLLEHLVFKGTPRHPNIPQELKERGAAFNGTTSADRTSYFETVTATPENLAWALDLEADRMVNSFIARRDLDTEMTVVRNEFEIGESSPGRVLGQAVSAAVYQWHNYGKSTIGARSDIENVSIDRLQAFYRTYYQPDNATLVVGGKIDILPTLAVIAEKFGVIVKPARVLETLYTQEPTQTGERAVTVRRTGDAPIVLVAHRIVSAQHADAAPLKVLGHLLGTTPTGRLHKRLVEPGKSTSTSANWFTGYDPGTMTLGAELRREDNPEAVRDLILGIANGFVAEPVTQAEVDRAKASFASRFEAFRADTQSVALAMTSAIGEGDWRLLFWARDQIEKVTVADVQRVALAYLRRDNRTTGIFLPTDTPERAVIAPRVDPAVLLETYVGGQAVAAAEDFDASPANIDGRTTVATLSTGLQLALLPKLTRGERVQGQLTLRFGTADTLKGRGLAPALVGDLLTKGTTRLDRGAFGDELTRLKATLSIGGGATAVTAAFTTTREHLPAVLALIAECLRTPAFAADEFEQIKRSRLRGLEGATKSPQALVGLRLSALFNAYPEDHPFYPPTLAGQRAQLEAVTLDDVRRFHAEFYGASHGQMSIVGSFAADAVTRQMEQVFGDWPSRRPYARIATTQASPAATSSVIVVPDQANATLTARLTFQMRDTDPEYPALVLANSIFGVSGMSSRLGNRLRQKEGLSYGSGSGVTVTVLDDAASFAISASYAPAVAAKLQDAVCEEVRRAVAEGFTEDEVAGARDGLLGSRRVAWSNDQTLVATLAGNLFYGRTMAWAAAFDEKIKRVTAAQASAAFKRAVDPTKLVVIKAGTLDPGTVSAKSAPCAG